MAVKSGCTSCECKKNKPLKKASTKGAKKTTVKKSDVIAESKAKTAKKAVKKTSVKKVDASKTALKKTVKKASKAKKTAEPKAE